MILYHYTSNEAFLSIIENKQIWLSSLDLSNDPSEGKYFNQLAKKYLEKEEVKKSLSKEGLSEDFYTHGFEFLTNTISALGISFSENSDSLSQWRAYADDAAGVAIGFDARKLTNYLEKIPGHGLTQVLYLTEHDNGLMNSFLSEIVEFEKTKGHELRVKKEEPGLVIPTKEDWEKQKKAIERSVSEKVKTIIDKVGFLYLVKNPFYEEEKEWRCFHLMLSSSYDDDHHHNLEFRVKKNTMIPYQVFPNKKFPNDWIVEIILGPKNKTPLDIIKLILKKYGFENTTVKRSEGSYR